MLTLHVFDFLDKTALDEMGTRIDDLEKSVGDLLKEASQDAGQVPASQQSHSVVNGQ